VWCGIEERRRTWWAIWEMGTYQFSELKCILQYDI
jgi:hypothetical protein